MDEAERTEKLDLQIRRELKFGDKSKARDLFEEWYPLHEILLGQYRLDKEAAWEGFQEAAKSHKLRPAKK